MSERLVSGWCEVKRCSYLDPIKCECLAERCIYDRCREDDATNDGNGGRSQRTDAGSI